MADKKKDNSYKNILKGTSFMGGVQIFQIIINAIRGKFVAIFLGTSGMGISTLFATPAATIQKFASLGLNLAIVKEVAGAEEDNEKLKVLLATVRKLLYSTAIFGAVITILLSGWLSEASFSDRSHTIEFMALGIMIFFTIAANGEMSVLQGLHQVKTLSKAAIVGSLTGLIVGVPLYYFFRDKGIVPAMIVLALSTYLFYLYSVRKIVSTKGILFSWKEHKPIMRQLLSIGFVLMASDIIGSGCTYILNVFVRMEGGLSSVGLFQAANSLTNQYSSLVFATMAMDYLPRLTAAAGDNKGMAEIVNRQSEIVAFIITPVVTLLIIFAPLVIHIFYTEEFITATGLLQWMGIAVLIKALSYPMGYITFAKDNKRLFFWLEGVWCNLQTLIFCAAGFYFFNLEGLAYGLLLDSLSCMIIYAVINKRLYSYFMSNKVIQSFLYAIIIPLVTFLTLGLDNPFLRYSAAGIIASASIAISFRQLKLRWKKNDEN